MCYQTLLKRLAHNNASKTQIFSKSHIRSIINFSHLACLSYLGYRNVLFISALIVLYTLILYT